MSTINGLVRNLQILSGYSNTNNQALNIASKKNKVSTVFKLADRHYAYGAEQDNSNRYPISENNFVDMSSKKEYVYSIECRDAVAKTRIDSNNLNFRILRINGDYNYTTNKDDGLFNIVFNDLPVNKTLKITVKIEGPSYLATYAQIVSDGVVGKYIQEINLVALMEPPAGVGINSVTMNQDDNGTTETTVLTIPSSESKYESASFEIPAGTKFYDKNGNILTGGINATIGQFSPTNNESYGLFYSGWTVGNIIIDGSPLPDSETVTFITGGFFMVEITDDNGNNAVSIRESSSDSVTPVRVKTSINPTLINPITNAPYVVGDTIPAWRLNPDGYWEQIDTAVVINDAGVLTFEFDMYSFSGINLDVPAQRCSDGTAAVIEVFSDRVVVSLS